MDDVGMDLAQADRAVMGLLGIADLLDTAPGGERTAAGIRALALEIDDALGCLRHADATEARNCGHCRLRLAYDREQSHA